jgi:hypothetical protein
MAAVADTLSLVDNIVRLRRAEEVQMAAAHVAPVRRQLEAQLGPTLSRSRAARILGVSQTAFDRWVDADQIPVVITPSGRREVPRQVVLELRESLDRLREMGIRRHPLSVALAERREVASSSKSASNTEDGKPSPVGHDTVDRRSLAYHRAVAERLDDRLLAEARERVEFLSAEGQMHPTYAERWLEVLALPLDRVAERIASDDPEARDLRQSSPFAGVLNEHERRKIIETVR